MNLTLRQLDTLILDPANVNTHPEHNLRSIADSLAMFGQVEPLVVQKSTGKVIGGNGRVEVMRGKGETSAYVVELDIDDTKAAALGIALNRTAKTSVFDDDGLAKLLASLPDDLQIAAGFDEKELAELINSLDTGPVVEDEAPAPLPDPVSRRGDVWLMGGHRLLCGDSTDAGDHLLLLGDAQIDAVVTDPPYGVGVAYASFPDDEASVKNLVEAFMPLVLKWPVAVLTSGQPAMWFYPRPKWVMAWIHPAGMGGGPWGFVQCNPILCYGDDPYLKRGLGRRPDSLVMAADREGVEGHPTPKPLSVWCWLVERATPEKGMRVLDVFSGSGTTLIACETIGRTCYAIEIEPRYVDVAVRRWQTLTGNAATLEATGATWVDTAAQRGVAVG